MSQVRRSSWARTRNGGPRPLAFVDPGSKRCREPTRFGAGNRRRAASRQRRRPSLALPAATAASMRADSAAAVERTAASPGRPRRPRTPSASRAARCRARLPTVLRDIAATASASRRCARIRLERARALAFEKRRAAAETYAPASTAGANGSADALHHDGATTASVKRDADGNVAASIGAQSAKSGDIDAGASSIVVAWLTMISGAITHSAGRDRTRLREHRCRDARAARRARVASRSGRNGFGARCPASAARRSPRATRGRTTARRPRARRGSGSAPAALPAGTACRRAARAVYRAPPAPTALPVTAADRCESRERRGPRFARLPLRARQRRGSRPAECTQANPTRRAPIRAAVALSSRGGATARETLRASVGSTAPSAASDVVPADFALAGVAPCALDRGARHPPRCGVGQERRAEDAARRDRRVDVSGCERDRGRARTRRSARDDSGSPSEMPYGRAASGASASNCSGHRISSASAMTSSRRSSRSATTIATRACGFACRQAPREAERAHEFVAWRRKADATSDARPRSQRAGHSSIAMPASRSAAMSRRCCGVKRREPVQHDRARRAEPTTAARRRSTRPAAVHRRSPRALRGARR